MRMGVSNSPGPVPGQPTTLSNRWFLSILMTRPVSVLVIHTSSFRGSTATLIGNFSATETFVAKKPSPYAV